MVLVTLLSLISFPESPKAGFEIPHADKLVHFFFYFVAGILGCFFIRERAATQFNLTQALVFAALFTSIYGIIIEVIQGTYTTYRNQDWNDALANAIGALSGVVFVKILFSRKSRLKWND